jgi:hypothetical protein
MIRHASSHGLSVLVTTILAAFLIELFKPLIPGILEKFEKVGSALVNTFKIPISAEALSVILVATLFGLIWGIFFRIGTRKRYIATKP